MIYHQPRWRGIALVPAFTSIPGPGHAMRNPEKPGYDVSDVFRVRKEACLGGLWANFLGDYYGI